MTERLSLFSVYALPLTISFFFVLYSITFITFLFFPFPTSVSLTPACPHLGNKTEPF